MSPDDAVARTRPDVDGTLEWLERQRARAAELVNRNRALFERTAKRHHIGDADQMAVDQARKDYHRALGAYDALDEAHEHYLRKYNIGG